MIKSHLKIIVLKILEKKPMTGYDLVKEIHESTHHWKPSFGSIYPLLKDLHNKGLVNVKVSGRKKVYSLTTKGKNTLKEIFKTKNKIYNLTMDSIKGLEAICTKEEIEFIHKLHSNLQSSFMPFKIASNEMQEFAEVMMRLSESKKMVQNEKKIRAIIKDTIMKLKNIGERK